MVKKELKVEDLPNNSMIKKIAPLRPETEGEVPRKPRRRKLKRPTVSKAQRRKRGLAGSIASVLYGEGSRNIGQYVIYEVIIPTAKSMIEDLVKGTIEMVLYNGESKRYSGSSRDSGTSRVSYGNYYKKENDRREQRRTPPGRSDRFGLDDIYFKRGDDADEVLDALIDELKDYDAVSVATFFEIAGIDGATWTHSNWGWTDLKRAYCTHTRDGYKIVFPDPKELD